MKTAVIIDRSLPPRFDLYSEDKREAAAFQRLLERYNTLVFSQVLNHWVILFAQKNEKLGKKALSDEEFLRESADKFEYKREVYQKQFKEDILRKPSVQLAVEKYNTRAGSARRRVSDVLDYIFELVILAKLADGDILCSYDRFILIEEIFCQSGVQCNVSQVGDLVQLQIKHPLFFITEGEEAEPLTIRALKIRPIRATQIRSFSDLYEYLGVVFGRRTAAVLTAFCFLIAIGLTMYLFAGRALETWNETVRFGSDVACKYLQTGCKSKP